MDGSGHGSTDKPRTFVCRTIATDKNLSGHESRSCRTFVVFSCENDVCVACASFLTIAAREKSQRQNAHDARGSSKLTKNHCSLLSADEQHPPEFSGK